MFNTLSSLKTVNPAFGGTDPIYTVLNSNFMQRIPSALALWNAKLIPMGSDSSTGGGNIFQRSRFLKMRTCLGESFSGNVYDIDL